MVPYGITRSRGVKVEKFFSGAIVCPVTMNTSAMPHSHLPYGEHGSGFYTNNVKGCFLVIDKATPLALKAIGKTITATEYSHPKS